MTFVKPLTTSECLRRLGLKKILQIFFFQSNSLRIFITNFVLTYNMRAGISMVIVLFGILRNNPKALFSLKLLLQQDKYSFLEEAVRTGLLVGLFTGIYRAVLYTLGKVNCYRFLLASKLRVNDSFSNLSVGDLTKLNTKKKQEVMVGDNQIKPEKWHSAVAGFVAALSLEVMDSSWHRTLALYMATRLVQCVYNFNRDNGLFHFWGSKWNHGNTLLFSVSVAQIMYAFVMRPETLPKSYYHFILRHNPLPEVVIKAVMRANRGKDVGIRKLLQFIVDKSNGKKEVVQKVLPFFFNVNEKMIKHANMNFLDVNSLMASFPLKHKITFVPDLALHPERQTFLAQLLFTFYNTGRQIFPVYLTLALVPAMAFRYYTFMKAPLVIFQKSFFNALRSTTFFSGICAIYMATVSLSRFIVEIPYLKKVNQLKTVEEIAKVPLKDNRYFFGLGGFLAGITLLIEKPSRRTELALYCLPRAADSLFLVAVDKKYLFNIPKGTLLLFCSSMGGIMYFYENNYNLLSPLVGRLLTRFLNNDIILRDREKLEHFDMIESFE